MFLMAETSSDLNDDNLWLADKWHTAFQWRQEHVNTDQFTINAIQLTAVCAVAQNPNSNTVMWRVIFIRNWHSKPTHHVSRVQCNNHVCNATLFSCWQLNVGITHTVTRNIQATATTENVPICIMTEHHPALLWCFTESGAAIYNTLWLTYLFTEYWTNCKVYRTKLQHKIIKWWKKEGHRVCKNLLHLSPIWNNSCLVVVDRQIH